jgi:hypothetical protein
VNGGVKMLNRSSEIEKIHKELFKNSPEYEYYSLGIVQGMSFMHELISTYKNSDISPEQWLKIINNSIQHEDGIAKYFNRLINQEK